MAELTNALEPQTAIVTGGSRGIGAGIVRALAESGYNVLFSYLSQAEDAAKVISETTAATGRTVKALQVDLADEAQTLRLMDEAGRMPGKLGALVNNAGFPYFHEIGEVDPEKMDELYRMHFRGPVLLMRESVRRMRNQGTKGAIVNITSTRAERAYHGDGIYGGMKAALTRASQSFALDAAPDGIRINCIAPGATAIRADRAETYEHLGGNIPLGRVGLPDDIARAAVWLLSENAAYMTGTTLRIDGGLSLPGMPEGAEMVMPWNRQRKGGGSG